MVAANIGEQFPHPQPFFLGNLIFFTLNFWLQIFLELCLTEPIRFIHFLHCFLFVSSTSIPVIPLLVKSSANYEPARIVRLYKMKGDLEIQLSCLLRKIFFTVFIHGGQYFL